MTNYYKATFSDGLVTKRSSERVYTHAWRYGYCSSEKLARQASKGEVVPVEVITEREYRRKDT